MAATSHRAPVVRLHTRQPGRPRFHIKGNNYSTLLPCPYHGPDCPDVRCVADDHLSQACGVWDDQLCE